MRFKIVYAALVPVAAVLICYLLVEPLSSFPVIPSARTTLVANEVIFFPGNTSKMKAAVFGGTGAVGQELVNQLVVNPCFSELVFIGRRPPKIPAATPDKPLVKYTNVVTDLDSPTFAAEVKPHLTDAKVVFCALGTTRKAAGSAEGFRKVDYGFVTKSAEVAKDAGASHFSLVSSDGANANVWANDLPLFQGLLYVQTKGKAEEFVKQQGFANTTIVRPGLLDRGEFARPVERFFHKVLSSIKVSDVAASMIEDALAPKEAFRLVPMKELQDEAAKRAAAPSP